MTNEHCNCPSGSHGPKHTAACYESRIARLRAALDRAPAVAGEPRETRFAWLLELKDSKHPVYFSPGWRASEFHWLTTDPYQAVQFTSRESADRLMNLFSRLEVAILTEEKWHPVEHGFMNRSSAEPGKPR